MKMKKVRSVLLAAALTCSMIVTPVMAAPDDTTSLQNQKESAQDEVNGLQAQLNELFTKTNDLETQLINKGQEITKAQEDLVAAEEKKQQQYEDMKLRIKYMYEMCIRDRDMRPLAKELNETFHGRGGGKSEMVQGSVQGLSLIHI